MSDGLLVVENTGKLDEEVKSLRLFWTVKSVPLKPRF